MTRILAWLCLVATLSGPFLREEEGAEDLARSLAELGRGTLVEEVDGGIGDDSGATILSAKQAVTIRLEIANILGEPMAVARGWTGIVDLLAPPVPPSLLLIHPPGFADTSLRIAWLARFLF